MSDEARSLAYKRERTGAADLAAEDLRLQILSGRLVRGTRLPSEKELAIHYQVSPSTMREAIRALSAMSLVQVRHGSGTYVVAETERLLSTALTAVLQLERVDLLSILEVSEALYVKSVRLGAVHATDAALEVLRAAADRLRADLQDREFAAALAAFLKALVGGSGNPLLVSLCGFLIDTQITLAEEVARRAPSTWQRTVGELVAERAAVVDALLSRDADAAEASVLAYMQRGEELVRDSLRRLPA